MSESSGVRPRLIIHVPRARGFESARSALASLGLVGGFFPGGEATMEFSSGEELTDFIGRLPSELSEWTYAGDAGSLEEALFLESTRRKKKIAVAESCTGGLVMARLTSIPGSSGYFWGGLVAYDNVAKVRLLGVDEELLSVCGAVSREVVEAMVKGVVEVSGADMGAAISGIAGPEGGTPDKPVGTVWVSVGDGTGFRSEKILFSGDRNEVRWAASSHAIWMLLSEVIK